MRTVWLGVAMLAFCACAERTRVRTEPPGATLYVNDRLVGTTPTVASVSRSEFGKPVRYRLELDGYETQEGEFYKRIGPGRIIAGGFSIGISLIFKRPTTFRPRHEFVLLPRPTLDNPIPTPTDAPAAAP